MKIDPFPGLGRVVGWAISILTVKRNVLKTGEQYLMKFEKSPLC